MRVRNLLGTMAVALAMVAACAAEPGQPTGDPVPVVATFSILGDIVRNVGGDAVSVTTLVGPGGDTHTFEPTPRDAERLKQARAVVEIGAGFEQWLDDLVKASGSEPKRIVATAGMDLGEATAETRKVDHGHDHANHGHDHADHGHDHADHGHNYADHGHDHADHGHGHAGHEHHHHGGVDPHVWNDVVLVEQMVATIRDGLMEVGPEHAEVIRTNSAAYLKRLNALNAWVEAQVTQIPAARRKLVTNHENFGHFARRYGFEVVGTVLGSMTTEVADPSPRDLARLVEAIRAAEVPAIFAETSHRAKVLQQVAREAGVRMAPALHAEALGGPGSGVESYEALMRTNVATIVEALR